MVGLVLCMAACDGDSMSSLVEDTSEPVGRTITVHNTAEVPLFVDTYPGFRVSHGEGERLRWTCASTCGLNDYGECGCAPASVSELLPGETLELSWAGEYWEERSENGEPCATRRTAGAGTYTLAVDYGPEVREDGGCEGTRIVGEPSTVTLDFEHPAGGVIEVNLPGG